MKISSENQLINAIGFQGIWWATVIYKGTAMPFVLLMVVAHFFGLKSGAKQELKIVIMVTAIGAVVDTVFTNLGFLDFRASAAPRVEFIPLWLITLWLAFACTIRHSLSWVFKKSSLAFVVGGVAGPLSYYAAANLEAIGLGSPLANSLVGIGFFWGLLFLGLSFFKVSSQP